MVHQLVGTIKLTGDDSVHFVNSLFNPTEEKIYHHNQLIDKIDSDITITENQDGFEAEIEDLDLSFVNEVNENKVYSEIMTKITIEIKSQASKWQNERSYISTKNYDDYSEVSEVYYLPCAA